MRVLVVGRGGCVADLFRSALGTAGEVSTSPGGRLAEVLAATRPNLLVVDESTLGSVAAVTLCRDARRASEVLPIIYASAKSGASDEVMALDAGADGFVALPCAPQLLHARMRALLRRQSPVNSELLSYGDLSVDTARRLVWRSDRQVQLTATEYALLCQFLRNPEIVLSRDELIARVWGADYSGNFGVLDVYICYLRGKLEAAGEERLIQTVRGAGYVLRASADAGWQESVASSAPRRRRAPVRVTSPLSA